MANSIAWAQKCAHNRFLVWLENEFKLGRIAMLRVEIIVASHVRQVITLINKFDSKIWGKNMVACERSCLIQWVTKAGLTVNNGKINQSKKSFFLSYQSVCDRYLKTKPFVIFEQEIEVFTLWIFRLNLTPIGWFSIETSLKHTLKSSIVTARESRTSASIVSSSRSIKSIFSRICWSAASEHRAARSAPTCPWVSAAIY